MSRKYHQEVAKESRAAALSFKKKKKMEKKLIQSSTYCVTKSKNTLDCALAGDLFSLFYINLFQLNNHSNLMNKRDTACIIHFY